LETAVAPRSCTMARSRRWRTPTWRRAPTGRDGAPCSVPGLAAAPPRSHGYGGLAFATRSDDPSPPGPAWPGAC